MIKKIVLVLGLLFMLVPISGAFAAITSGYSSPVINNYAATANIQSTIDSNLSTYSNLQGNGYVEFNIPPAQTLNFWTGNSASGSGNALYKYSFYDSSNKLISTSGDVITIKNVNKTTVTIPEGSTKFRIESKSSIDSFTYYNFWLYEIEVSAPIIKHDEISNLNVESSGLKNQITWGIPSNNSGFIGSKIYRNGELIKTINGQTTQYSDENVQYSTTYNYKVTATYSDGFETQGISKDFTTVPEPVPAGDVTNVKASTTFEKVNISWVLPTDETFKHVNIYREKLEEDQTSMLDKLIFGTKVYAAEKTKIFETNGTYFNDLTVEPSTTYEYKLTTYSIDNLESEGVIVQATTEKEPPPKITKGGIQQQENGDYKYTWEEPTEGTVKIIVGDKEYTANASDKEIVIPKEDMKYNGMGDPDIQAIPVSKYGKEGIVEKAPSLTLSEIKIPFQTNDLISSGTQLLWLVGPFVLLALSFLLVPKLRKLIVRAFKGKGDRADISERRTKSEKVNSAENGSSSSERIRKNRETHSNSKGLSADIRQKKPKEPREVKIRERQIKEPKAAREHPVRERLVKEPKLRREPRQEREPRVFTRSSRIPREVRKGR
ncbi:hypothetical protein [Niallia sp. 03133]|uniref:hypothetical protein n=1 Tax=Niallia sp. 03133 TaxID=3458060 RepID=UPI0040440D7C